MPSQTCIRCGVFLSTPAEVTYSDEGDAMCVACRERIDLGRKEAREARTLTGLAVSSLLGAIVGLPISFIFVLGGIPFSLPSFGSATMCLKGLKAAPPGVLAALGSRAALIRVTAIVAQGLSGLGLAVMTVQIVTVLFELATRPR